MTNTLSHLPTVLCALLVSAIVGCGGGPKLNEVSGKVTIDGVNPSAALEILFMPVDNQKHTIGTGRSVVQRDGTYKMYYPGGKEGVPAGEYTVSIEVVPDDESQEGRSRLIIPERYNSATELKATVKPGKNENIDFDISLKR